MDYLSTITEVRGLFEGADFIGVKTVESDDTLVRFLIKIFSYRPGLVRCLYRLRAPLVRLLGFRQDPLPALSGKSLDAAPALPISCLPCIPLVSGPSWR